VRTILRHIMAELAQSYDLLAIPDGATVLTVLAERPVALIITDLRLPDMDGIALTAAVKAAAAQCLVMLITGDPAPETEQRAEAAGVNYFLPKPFRIDQLAALVRTALAGSQAAQLDRLRPPIADCLSPLTRRRRRSNSAGVVDSIARAIMRQPTENPPLPG
jgi:DNA-binding NtrC family response regulator